MKGLTEKLGLGVRLCSSSMSMNNGIWGNGKSNLNDLLLHNINKKKKNENRKKSN
jgi:hypothetical protein